MDLVPDVADRELGRPRPSRSRDVGPRRRGSGDRV